MEDINLYKNLYNENYTDARKEELIQLVFENKAKSLLSKKSETFKFANGGGVDKDVERIYTPYEFLHELLPLVYKRPYVVSDEVGLEYDAKIKQDEIELEEFTNSKLIEYGVTSLYKINDIVLIEEIEIRRRKLISDKSFITESELIAYLFCHPELHTEHYVGNTPTYDVKDLISRKLVMIDYDKNNSSYEYVYVHEYLSGNLYKKLTDLRLYKQELIKMKVFSDEQFAIQETALKNNLPKKAKITLDVNSSLFILPQSQFGYKFIIKPEDFVEEGVIHQERSFIEAFREWTETEDSFDKILISNIENTTALHKYFTDFELLGSKPTEREKIVYAELRTKAYMDGKVLLLEFMNKALTLNCQLRLEYEWNELYNYYTEPRYYKIPVACQLSSKFKYGSNFTPNETQIQSIQFEKAVGSGLLAYGVGVGKTASAILNVSYALDNGLCKKPLFVVPNPTYEKWKKEMFGGVAREYVVQYQENGSASELSFDNKTKATKFAKATNGTLKESVKKIFGHIPHRNKVVDLFNLNEDYIRNIKDYTEEEELALVNISQLNKLLKKQEDDYDFIDENINNQILELYPQFSYDLVLSMYDEKKQEEYDIWYSKPKNQRDFSWGGRGYFNENVFDKTLMQVFKMNMKIYREEMPYTTGTLKTFEDGTIFFATYDGLKHLGLLLEDKAQLKNNYGLYGELFSEISQGDNVSSINYNAKNSLPVLWKNAVFGKNKTKVDITDLGIDYAVFDESHFLKKVFTDCKGLPVEGTRGGTGTTSRSERKYKFGEGEFPSATALAGFFITRYIQENNKYKNVIHLTATPFTNKPAEIYSMMALTNGKMLTESGFEYMEQFFDVFMDISYELIFGNTGVERKESLLGYRNLPQLRNLIYSMMDYKSGEDANIKRPQKMLFPSVANKIETTLPESEIQDELFKQIKDYQRGKISWNQLCADSQEDLDIDEQTEEQLLEIVNDKGTDEEKDKFQALEKPLEEDDFDSLKKIVRKIIETKVTPFDESKITNDKDRDSFRVVQGLGVLKAVTLSPYLSTCQKEAGIEPTYTQYIETSPKLNYTLSCVKSIHDYEFQNNLRKSGVVIYMSTGVNVSYTYKNANGEKITFKWSESGFQKIKQYLVQKMGYTNEEVSIVAGGMSSEDKERAKNSFLSGKSTVLIGSSSISTGIDLQDNASALFLCSYDWNPTDNEQISGRIHRQGNRFKEIRIVYPMVMNSADPNIFQQLYEKTLRIKNIWDRNDKGNTLDLKDFDVNSLRKGILDDPEDLAKYWLEENKEFLSRNRNILNFKLEDLRNADYFENVITKYEPVVKGLIVILDAYRKSKDKQEIKDRLDKKLQEVEDEYDDIEDLEEKYAKIGKEKAKIVKETYDFKNDPDGRYRFLTYDELGSQMDILKKSSTMITNTDSYWRNKVFSNDKDEIKYNWLQATFPRFYAGKYNLDVPDEEDTVIRINFHVESDLTEIVNKWKGAVVGMKKLQEKLGAIGVNLEDVAETRNQIQEQIQVLNEKIESLETIYPQKIVEYTALKQERRIIQPTIQKRVDEFSAYNPMLHKTVTTFEEDTTKYTEVPLEILDIKPKKKIKQIIEEAVLVEPLIEEEEVSEIDTTDLIENLKKGLLVRFNFGLKKGKAEVVDIFYENGEFIAYTVYEDSKGEIISDEEDILTEKRVIDFYIEHFDKISEQFYDDEVEEIEEIEEIEESNVKLKDWYTKNYPTDDLGEDIDDDNTFEDLWNGLHNKVNVYDIIGFGDSVLRERLFEHLSEIKGVDYDYVYNKWIGAEEEPAQIEEKTQKQNYREIIEGYELLLEIETDEEKIKLYNDLIEGYELVLELQN